MPDRYVDPHEVVFKGTPIPKCRYMIQTEEAETRGSVNDGLKYRRNVEVSRPQVFLKGDFEDLPAACGFTLGQHGILTFKINPAGAGEPVTITASNAHLVRRVTNYLNHVKGMSFVRLIFECVSTTGNSAPVSTP